MTNAHKKLGAWGESVAATHLEAHGYTIVARNWRCPVGEIDLVAQKGALLAFVEVKTRRGGNPEDQITPRKAQKLLETAQTYLLENNLDDIDFSIDVIAVALDRSGKLLRCDHYPNAVTAW
ncbi:MAG: YraN family protein [Anaerolineae bacterium]|nr:YraN family protein [Anaerolineae bacterium]MCO5187293.1 YraN family protein [Anaerolineae bacterium]MCO5191780.1 YraN family protein [Anaerolineae bacterium]